MSSLRFIRIVIMFLSFGFVFPHALSEAEDRKPAASQEQTKKGRRRSAQSAGRRRLRWHYSANSTLQPGAP
jgi:hypothetical protein